MERIITRTDFHIPKIIAQKRVAAYARVSTGKETMLLSLSAQISHYSALIQSHPDWRYVGVYADQAISGTKVDRAEFQRLIDDCRAGKIDMIITKSISRFARNSVAMLETVRELKELGVDVFFESENINSIGMDGEFMLTILAGLAEAESRSVSDNCKWRLRQRFMAGELATLRFMFGYRIRKGKVEIDPEQADIVRMIFSDYIGGDGCGKIAKKLQAMNVRGLRDAVWTPSRIARLLKNEKYAGNAILMKRYRRDHLTKALVKNDGEMPKYLAKGTNPAIIDETTFQLVQERMAKQRERTDVDAKAPQSTPFSGLIRCAHCGKNYKRIVVHGRPAWNCSTYLVMGKAHCHAKKIPEDILKALCATAIGATAFSRAEFESYVRELVVHEQNKITFKFQNGHSLELSWKDSPRGAGWSPNSRQGARDRMIQMRRQSLCAHSHQ